MTNQTEPIGKEEKDYYSIQKKFWTIAAPFYDIVVAPGSRIRDTVVSFTGASQGAKILDVATGTGKQAFAFAQKGYDVTGIDLSQAMLKIARRKNKYQNLKLEAGDARRLPFDAGAFDVTCISFALHEMPLTVREEVLQEMVRVTKPSGTIMIIDFALPKNKIRRFFIYQLVKLFEGSHYVKYIRNDLKISLTKVGIAVSSELPILFGGATIIKGSIA